MSRRHQFGVTYIAFTVISERSRGRQYLPFNSQSFDTYPFYLTKITVKTGMDGTDGFSTRSKGAIDYERSRNENVHHNDVNDSCRDHDRPAKSHEERVICFRAELDASQQTERRVLLHRLVEFHHVQIFDGYPSKYRPTDTHNPVLLMR